MMHVTVTIEQVLVRMSVVRMECVVQLTVERAGQETLESCLHAVHDNKHDEIYRGRYHNQHQAQQ